MVKILATRLSFTSLDHLVERLFDKKSKKRLSLSVFFEYLFSFRWFLVGKLVGTRGFGPVLDGFGVHEVDEVVYLAIYYLWTFIRQCRGLCAKDDGRSFAWEEAWGSLADEVELWYFRRPATRWVNYLILAFETVNSYRKFFVSHLFCNNHIFKHSNSDDM